MRAPLPKRFYKDVTVRQEPDGYAILLDGRPVKTPGKKPLAVPSPVLAEAVAEEWRAQDKVIDPSKMPLTRIVNSTIEGVIDHRSDVADDVVAFAGSDLLCYRAAGPEVLVARQSAAWDPIIAWAAEDLGARFVLAEGIMPIEQSPTTLEKIAAAVRPLDPFRLAALHVVTTLTGSALIALAVLNGRLTAAEAWAAAHIDEDYEIEQWGRDVEADERRAARSVDMHAACFILRQG